MVYWDFLLKPQDVVAARLWEKWIMIVLWSTFMRLQGSASNNMVTFLRPTWRDVVLDFGEASCLRTNLARCDAHLSDALLSSARWCIEV
jgi:hypothetical protein